jgi:thiol-disulfide isomerase/thioredoxin
MKHLTISFIALLMLALVVACSPAPATNKGDDVEETAVALPTTDDMKTDEGDMADEGDMMMAEDEMAANEGDMAEEDSMMAEEDSMMTDEDDRAGHNLVDLPAWQTIVLTDARTGESFSLADFMGKTVFVEPMATWCTNCRQQLGNVNQVAAQAGDEVVFVALSLETNLNPADLSLYAESAGFDWLFAVMTPEMLQSLSDTFGRSITSAPSTPHFFIRPDGSHTDLATGIKSPAELQERLQAAQG